ncbi:hypothetical protein EXT46_12885 [Pseudoalteromonas sp. CO325X]|uniref:hypothetical protein n=1 Tax=Pseudoalteromonas sp. CO325X TaxID=1777262 RepID=UPI001022B6E7|nr:hypothetical protein [Pseudoalteromonas sp. CO325X]RZF80189.1 hypothetical protein EXT46_12885 [Pseudoalteromonas sp. CO325X]
MERIRRRSEYLLGLPILIFLGACSNTYWGIIKNETDGVVKVKLTLVNEHGTQVLELLPIEPKDSSIWEYEQSSFVISKIDKDLSSVEATNTQGCTVTFARKAIEEHVARHRQKIVIGPQYFIDACGKQK